MSIEGRFLGMVLAIALILPISARAEIPSIPDVPFLPASSSALIPGAPSIPGIPSIPGMPSIPGLPNIPQIPTEYDQIFQLVESILVSYYFPATIAALATCQVDTELREHSVLITFHQTDHCPIAGTLEFERPPQDNEDTREFITKVRLTFQNLQYIKALDFDAYLDRKQTLATRNLHYLILNGRVAIQPEPTMPTIELYMTAEGQRQKSATATNGSSRTNVYEKITLTGFSLFTKMSKGTGKKTQRNFKICLLQKGTPGDVNGGELSGCVGDLN